jgi:transcriptional regulator with XRE-family HTH domain
MTKPFRDLVEKLPAERRERIDRETQALITEYELLKTLREDCHVTQEELAELMGVRQASISKIENQRDIRLVTLQKYIEALGGELDIRVSFPDRNVSLRQFTKADSSSANPQKQQSL